MNNKHVHNKAQTAIELAIFGAILIFVLGVTIRSALNFSLTQQHMLKAMRWALSTSYKHTEGIAPPFSPDGGTASRNTATVLVIEDRLTAESGKYGAIDRNPYISVASATHSRNLFLPIDYNEHYHLPVFDLFINGKHFVFRLGSFRSIDLSNENATNVTGEQKIPVDWEPECTTKTNPGPPPFEEDVGCAKLYEFVPNHHAIARWCNGIDDECPGDTPQEQAAVADQRFDLDRDGTTDVSGEERRTFSWQWREVLAKSGEIVTGDNGKNDFLDVDGDSKEERIMKLDTAVDGIIPSMQVLDFQAGDLDFSHNPARDPGPRPGLTNDTEMWTFTRDGTHLLVEEGKLFEVNGDDKQYIRSAQKKDQIDVIVRYIQLSNNTGTYCKNGVIQDTMPTLGIPNPIEACCNSTRGTCGRESDSQIDSCFSTENLTKTCMDEGNVEFRDADDLPDPVYPMIFVRSRVLDAHGRKWVTDTSDDNYVNFR